MVILFFFIVIIPFAITGIIWQLGLHLAIRPTLKSGIYPLSILLFALIFYLPLIVFSQFYFLWLFWIGVILSISYFIVRQNKHELSNNVQSRWAGSLVLISTMTACFIYLYPKAEPYDNSVQRQLIKAMQLHTVISNDLFKGARLYIQGDTVFGISDKFHLHEPVFQSQYELFFCPLNSKANFKIVKAADSDIDANNFSEVCYRNKDTLYVPQRQEVLKINFNGGSSICLPDADIKTDSQPLFYKDKGIYSHFKGIDIIDLKTGATVWQQKIEPYKGGVSKLLLGNLLIVHLEESDENNSGWVTKQHLFAIDLNSFTVKWDKGNVINHKSIINKYWADSTLLAIPDNEGFDILDPLTGKHRYRINNLLNIVSVLNNKLFSLHNQVFTAWNIKTSDKLWEIQIDEIVLAFGKYLVARRGDYILLIDLINGNMKAKIHSHGQDLELKAVGQFIYSGNTLYR